MLYPKLEWVQKNVANKTSREPRLVRTGIAKLHNRSAAIKDCVETTKQEEKDESAYVKLA